MARDPLHLQDWSGQLRGAALGVEGIEMNRIRSKLLFFLLIVMAVAALALPAAAAAGWTWDSAGDGGWTWDGSTGTPDSPPPTADQPA